MISYVITMLSKSKKVDLYNLISMVDITKSDASCELELNM